jgi:hypothetical protein
MKHSKRIFVSFFFPQSLAGEEGNKQQKKNI